MVVMEMGSFFSLIVFGAVAYSCLHIVLRFLRVNGVVAENYRGELIPISTGLYFAVLFLLFLILLRVPVLSDSFDLGVPYSLFTLFVWIVFFVGWLDDSIGDRTVKGFKGHIRKWRKERVVTTGLLKAVTIAFVSLWTVWEINSGMVGVASAVYIDGSIVTDLSTNLSGKFVTPASDVGKLGLLATVLVGLLHWLLITLSANTFNLLDLRPGRALKFAMLIVLIIVLFGRFYAYFQYLFPLVIGILLLLPSDVRGRSMLGDAGANLLGYILGFCVVISCPLWLQLLLLGGYITLHLAAERMSLSRYIESKRLLQLVDRWGK